MSGADVVVTTGGANLSFEVDADVVEAIPEDARFELSVTDDLGTRVTAARRLARNDPDSGLTWGTVLTAVVVALFAGGFLGNLLASRRRPPARLSVYGTIQRRIDEERKPTPDGRMSGGLYTRLIDRARDGSPVQGRGPRMSGRSLRLVSTPPGTGRALRDDVEVKVFKLRWGNDYAMVANPTDLVHYQLSVDEAELLELMDGTRTVKEIVVERFQGSGGLELDEVADLVRLLREGNFLTDRYVDTTEIVRKARGSGLDGAREGRASSRRPSRSSGAARTGSSSGSTATGSGSSSGRAVVDPGRSRRGRSGSRRSSPCT